MGWSLITRCFPFISDVMSKHPSLGQEGQQPTSPLGSPVLLPFGELSSLPQQLPSPKQDKAQLSKGTPTSVVPASLGVLSPASGARNNSPSQIWTGPQPDSNVLQTTSILPETKSSRDRLMEKEINFVHPMNYVYDFPKDGDTDDSSVEEEKLGDTSGKNTGSLPCSVTPGSSYCVGIEGVVETEAPLGEPEPMFSTDSFGMVANTSDSPSTPQASEEGLDGYSVAIIEVGALESTSDDPPVPMFCDDQFTATDIPIAREQNKAGSISTDAKIQNLPRCSEVMPPVQAANYADGSSGMADSGIMEESNEQLGSKMESDTDIMDASQACPVVLPKL